MADLHRDRLLLAANAEAWPSQETIAKFTGYSSRAVRYYVDVLERGAIVRLHRERRAARPSPRFGSMRLTGPSVSR